LIQGEVCRLQFPTPRNQASPRSKPGTLEIESERVQTNTKHFTWESQLGHCPHI
jgi:hypothetical protein